MARVPPANPLIVVLGATGTGKSQLAVELAKRHNGEIINGDAMQLYAGLPIITNKITPEEQQDVPHHLLGCISLAEQPWVVGTFVRHALAKIAEIRSRGHLPILVGGTHYYAQSLLFKDRLTDDAAADDTATLEFIENVEEKWPILKASNEEIMTALREVDPLMAQRWHPNDRRKIQRSLEIFLKTGRKASDVYAEQRQRGGAGENGDENDDRDGPEMRFSTLLFWVHSERAALCERLDRRVDVMMQQGLLQEVEELEAFASSQAAQPKPIEEDKGIWVSIGYKEFKDYARARRTPPEGTGQGLDSLKDAALERTKIATRQYSKRQITWIRIKLINALREAQSLHRLYLLDSSDATAFDHAVVAPALDCTEQFLRGEEMPLPSSLSPMAAELLLPKREREVEASPHSWHTQHCELCDTTCASPGQWAMHVRSKSHRKLASRARQEEKVRTETDALSA